MPNVQGPQLHPLLLYLILKSVLEKMIHEIPRENGIHLASVHISIRHLYHKHIWIQSYLYAKPSFINCGLKVTNLKDFYFSNNTFAFSYFPNSFLLVIKLKGRYTAKEVKEIHFVTQESQLHLPALTPRRCPNTL